MSFDYTVLLSEKLSVMTYLLMACALVSLWWARAWKVWGTLFAGSILFALLSHRLSAMGFMYLLVFAAIVYYYYHARNILLKNVSLLVVITLGILVLFHFVPGFSNWLVINDLHLSNDAYPLNVYLNFDKAAMGLLLLAMSRTSLLKHSPDFIEIVRKSYKPLIIGVLCIIGTAYQIQYVKLDFKLPPSIGLWAFNNLLFACIPEEVFFRGFIQVELSRVFKGWKYGSFCAIAMSVILFAAIHRGPIHYLLLSAMAGILYSIIYLQTKRIEASILGHFILNLVHFLCFTYPALRH